MNAFEEAIKEYCDGVAKNDESFAEKYNNSKKSIAECCRYIISEVTKTGRQGFADEEIYGMAMHYYDEDLEVPSKVPAVKVVTNKPLPAKVRLSDDDKARLREEAEKKYMEQQMAALRERKIKAEQTRKARVEKAAREDGEKQGSLFE